MSWAKLTIMAAAAMAAVPALADETPLRPGAYLVTYSLELPHVAGSAGGEAKVCLTGAGDTTGFPVLSANNPLARCPVENLRRSASDVSFAIVCRGPNAAKAEARFTLRDGAFDGRIAMNMGGKNMTMTEVQHGARVGDCETPATQ